MNFLPFYDPLDIEDYSLVPTEIVLGRTHYSPMYTDTSVHAISQCAREYCSVFATYENRTRMLRFATRVGYYLQRFNVRSYASLHDACVLLSRPTRCKYSTIVDTYIR